MLRICRFVASLCLSFGILSLGAQLSPQWEELTSPDFPKAIQKADGVCLLPMGSIEKFGPSGPLGTGVFLCSLPNGVSTSISQRASARSWGGPGNFQHRTVARAHDALRN